MSEYFISFYCQILFHCVASFYPSIHEFIDIWVVFHLLASGNAARKLLEISREHFMQMWYINDGNGMDLTEAEDMKKRWQEYTEEL